MEPDFETIGELFSLNERVGFMQAYCDESGKHAGARVITVAGLMLAEGACKELQRRWIIEANKEPKIPLPFHMTDCEVGRKSFEYLENDDDSRFKMQRRLIETMRGLDMQAYGTSIDRESYKAVKSYLRPNESLQDPWFFAFESGIQEMIHRSSDRGKSHKLSFVFDRQDEFKERAFAFYNEILNSKPPWGNRLGRLSFDEKGDVAALQAIDIVAYEMNKRVSDHFINSDPPRWQSELLRECFPKDALNGCYWDAQGLTWLNDLVIADRSKTKNAI